jgi:membrane associated rhomboid family serine protease
MIRNLPPLTRLLIILFVGFFLLLLLAGRFVLGLLPVVGTFVFPGMELWRLVTYPFTVGLMSALAASVITYFFGAELETIVGTAKLAPALIATVILGGLIFTFMAPENVLAGPDMITLFLLTGFVYMWPRRQISIMGAFFVPAWVIGAAFLALSILPSTGTKLDTTASKFFAPVFSVIASALFFHFTYHQYSVGRELILRLRSIFSRTKAASTQSSGWSQNMSTQGQVDAILDKISRKGIESLTREERQFLDRYSGKS